MIQHGTTHDTISLFQKVLEEKRIPDFSRLYLAGILSIEDVLLFRDNIHGEKFRHWYLTTHYDSEKVHEVLLSKNIPQSILTKWLRFIIPNAIGIANAPVGIVAGAIDSFIIDKIVGGWHPNIFLDDILKSEIDSRLKLHAEKTRRDSIKSRFPNVGRNDPCPCSSGKKFKRCCGEGL
ncbi:MAG TPA: SEC-C metal-binding domain-containing protein [Verrucomicrobiae bacterium]